MTRDDLGEEIIDAFLSRVEYIPSGCWEWRGQKNTAGYGVLRDPLLPGHYEMATHISLVLLHNEIDDSLYALHHCDNPGCVHPEHLFLGSALDNTQDMVAKGRDNFWGYRNKSKNLETETVFGDTNWMNGRKQEVPL